MRDSIRRPDRESSVQNTRQKRHAVWPPGLIVPFTPHKRSARMFLWHSSHNDDCDEASKYNQEKAALVQEREEAIAEDDKGAARPGYNDEGHEDVPGFDCQVRVEDGIHLNNHVGGNGDNRSQVKDPAGKVEIAGEEAYDAAVTGAGRDGRPMVYAAGRGNCRCQLEDFSRNKCKASRCFTSAMDAPMKP